MPINTIVGQAATGDNFYNRPKLINDIWRIIKSGSNLLLVAPRRVGKTSILYYLQDNPEENFNPLYLITESVNDENEFFRKLYGHVFELLDGIDKFSQRIKNLVGKNKISEISKNGLKIEGADLNYYDALVKLFEVLDLDGSKLIIMIDEFPETVENIKRDNNEIDALRFLQKNRELRHSTVVKEKVQFIYAGSIGLENVVSKINASSTIDDLHSFNVPPFTKKEARELISEMILKDSEMGIKEQQIDFLFEKIEWLIPFYIQLILDETYKLYSYEELNEVTNEVIERAIDKSIQHKLYFDLWLSRLKTSFKGDEFSFVKAVLNYASEHDTITSAKIYDYAEGLNITDMYKDIVNTLVYDGYINNSDDPKIYRFNSPILKRWWYKYVAN
ncbi:MAG: ATP-binding protein [Candidatus Cloacimonetes bacterium]|nr:ATP-binding protein [Candidatus Cloacimonadota bacterium]MCF8393995.1 ATP-binding protein [Melioribacteraceae bacterium]